jgi:hypothetical protein
VLSTVCSELVNRNWAHSDLEQDEIVSRVRDQQLRPELPEWCPPALKDLIVMCWHEVGFCPRFVNQTNHIVSKAL